MRELHRDNLESLIDAFEIISSSLNSDEILQRVMEQVCQLMKAEAASIFLLDKESLLLHLKVATNLQKEQIEKIKVPVGSGLVGYVAETGELVNTNDVHKDSRFYSEVDKITGFKTRSCLTVPLIIDDKIVGAAQVLNKRTDAVFNKEDEILLTEFARLAAITLDKAWLHEQIVEKEKLEFDLNLAHSIQNSLLPTKEFIHQKFFLKGYYQPARHVGGDYFDYIKYSDSEIFFTIGDVSGKGAQASLLMASVKAYLSASIESKIPLLDMINNLNKFLYVNTPEEKFITMFFGIINLEDGTLSYVNAGHEPAVLVRSNGEIEELSSTGLMIGIVENWNYEQQTTKLSSNDLLFIYTDGIIDCRNKDFQQFGYEAIKDILISEAAEPLNLFTVLPQKLNSFARGIEQFDDITFLIVHHL